METNDKTSSTPGTPVEVKRRVMPLIPGVCAVHGQVDFIVREDKCTVCLAELDRVTNRTGRTEDPALMDLLARFDRYEKALIEIREWIGTCTVIEDVRPIRRALARTVGALNVA